MTHTHAKYKVNSNFVKYHSPKTTVSVDESIESSWNFAENTAVWLLCFVENFSMINQMRNLDWRNMILRDLSFEFGGDIW